MEKNGKIRKIRKINFTLIFNNHIIFIPQKNIFSNPKIMNKTIPFFKTKDAKLYKKIEQIGEGTYGQVFVAIDIFTNELVAMKKV